jgi:hypothetical protein
MKIIYDRSKLTGKYNRRNLSICRCGKHRYPSKKMLVEFLKRFKDVKGTAEVWSREDWDTSEVVITVEIHYNVTRQHPPPEVPKE